MNTQQRIVMRRFAETLLVLASLTVLTSCSQQPSEQQKPISEAPVELPVETPVEPPAGPPTTDAPAAESSADLPAKPQPIALFDGKSLNGWKLSEFGGDGDVRVEDGKLILGFGESLTGVTWDGGPKGTDFKLPRDNYEISLEAMRVDGSDFFCGLTFPVGKEPCSLILGGWGGGVVGLSSINQFDASENETTQFYEFEDIKWYRVRLRVTPAKIEAWIDDKQIVDVSRKDNEFSVRVEVELSKPLGFASWQTTAALRNITLLPLAAESMP